MMKNRIVFSALFLIVSSIGVGAEETRPLVDATARTAIISAYEPEWVELRAALHEPTQYAIGRTIFLTSTIEDKPVLLFLSGISMVNAALTSSSRSTASMCRELYSPASRRGGFRAFYW